MKDKTLWKRKMQKDIDYRGADDPIWQAPVSRVKECFEACEGLNPAGIKPLIDACEKQVAFLVTVRGGIGAQPLIDALNMLKTNEILNG